MTTTLARPASERVRNRVSLTICRLQAQDFHRNPVSGILPREGAIALG
ncbi:MAG: hypothetical protein GDA56_31010 [Hormoscilla sp. GM7CHS1pb]|nr:hypothetical protein [Hormoscilla sp. GM7CHS1pb]